MKQVLLGSVLALASVSAFSHPAHTQSDNPCISDMSSHINQTFGDFYGCKLHDKDVFSLLTKLKANYPEVDDLDLTSNNIGNEGAAELADNFELVKQYQSISLENNHIGDKGIAQLAKIPTVSYLNVANNNITDVGAISLSKSTTLERLSIGENNLTPIGVVALTKIGSLSELDLEKIPQDDTSLYALSRTKLQFLDLIYAGLSHKDLNYFSNHAYLKGLAVNGNKLFTSDIAAISSNKNMMILLADDNLIDDEGATLLASNTDLLSISLNRNKITDTGAMVFANNKNLKFLGLADNAIGDAGATALSTSNLDMLFLHRNHIGDKGTTALAQNPSLFLLTLGGNNLHDAGAFALASNKGKLMYLDVSYNHIGVAGIKALEERFSELSTEGNISNIVKKSRGTSSIIKSYCGKIKSAFCKKIV